MAEPFLSEIRLMSFNFAPKGWALCNGQLLPINQNQALFSLLGTTYGGDGQTNFALPDLRGTGPDPRRQRSHAGRAGRRAGAHADHRPSCRRTPTWCRRSTANADSNVRRHHGTSASPANLLRTARQLTRARRPVDR